VKINTWNLQIWTWIFSNFLFL